MHLSGLLWLAGLCADAGAMVSPDAGVPPWAPQMKPVGVTGQTAFPLQRAGEGFVYDSVQFQARVAPDGTVSFHDKLLPLSFSLFPFVNTDLPTPRRQPTLENILRRHFTQRPPRPTSGPGSGVPSRIEPNEVCPPSSSCFVLPTSNITQAQANFDLTDEFMRNLGQDPYRQEKARFLSHTFEFRMGLAATARKDLLAEALNRLPARLDNLWSDRRYTRHERRRVLYDLWYQSAPTPEGTRAAAIITGFIRRRLPCKSPDAYSPAELTTFNQLHPNRPFAPYPDCSSPETKSPR